MREQRSRLVHAAGAAACGAVAAVLAVAGPASAHVEASPATVKVGTKATVAFMVQHGCGTSPTIRMSFTAPAGLDVQPVAKKGWRASVSKGVVSFVGGNLGPHAHDSFSLTFTAPTAPGTLVFPTVQKCVKGANAWIQKTVPGQPEPDFPAPVVKVVAGTAAAGAAPATTAMKM